MSPPAHGLDSMVGLVNLVIRGQVPSAIRPYSVGALLVPYMMVKADIGGIRPIACVGLVRRLVSKVAVWAVVPSLTAYLRPLQVRLGVSGGGEWRQWCTQ